MNGSVVIGHPGRPMIQVVEVEENVELGLEWWRLIYSKGLVNLLDCSPYCLFLSY